MSHSSGIPVSGSLREKFGSAISSGNDRLLKAQIENEEIVIVTTVPPRGSWEDDLSLIPELLEKEKPCYILYRFEHNSTFALFCYVPDKAKVKEKMLYASTRANLKQQLGMNYFSDEVFGTVPDDFSLKGYKLHVTSKKTEAPLTDSEQMKRNEQESGEIYTGGASTYVHGVSFPVEAAAADAVKKVAGGQLKYAQIAIDCDKERIILDHTGNVDFEGLRGQIPLDQPRFHFFAYPHDFEGSKVTSQVYVYSCPDGSKGTKSAPVRMRMLYSSSKAAVAEIMTQVGSKIDGRLEVNSGEDLDEEELINLLHPQAAAKKQEFSKPSRPGKGGRKLIRDK